MSFREALRNTNTENQESSKASHDRNAVFNASLGKLRNVGHSDSSCQGEEGKSEHPDLSGIEFIEIHELYGELHSHHNPEDE